MATRGRLLAWSAALSAVATSYAGGKTPAVAYDSFKFGKHYYHKVTVDVASGATMMKTVHSPTLVSPWKLINQQQPLVAITGTFFGPKSQTPVADVLVGGQLVAFGNRGSGVGMRRDGTVSLFDTRFQQSFDWSEFDYGLRGAVRIVSRGVVQPNPKAQKFKDPSIWGSAARTGLGLTKHGKLVLVATTGKITLSQLGKAMKAQGVTEAISLDGGSSTCFYYNGKMLIGPQRKLSNMIVITKRA